MSSVIEKYAGIFSAHKQKPAKAERLLEQFFQERLDEIEAQADELLAEATKSKKETVH